jgi:hypothetical protein
MRRGGESLSRTEVEETSRLVRGPGQTDPSAQAAAGCSRGWAWSAACVDMTLNSHPNPQCAGS